MAGQAGARATSTHGCAAHTGRGARTPDAEPAPGNLEHGQHASGNGGTGHSEADALEAALEQLGPFGLYQRYMLLMLCIPSVLAAMYSLNYVFVAGQVPFR